MVGMVRMLQASKQVNLVDLNEFKCLLMSLPFCPKLNQYYRQFFVQVAQEQLTIDRLFIWYETDRHNCLHLFRWSHEQTTPARIFDVQLSGFEASTMKAARNTNN